MAFCEFSGKEVDRVVSVNIAGTTINVAPQYANLGKQQIEEKAREHSFYKRRKTNVEYEVVSNFTQVVNKEISKRGWTLHQLARVSNIKESSLQKYMQGKLYLDIDTARKLESCLKIVLVEEVSGKPINTDDFLEEESGEGASLGDLLMKQMKNKG